jgi:hypothetical protein
LETVKIETYENGKMIKQEIKDKDLQKAIKENKE